MEADCEGDNGALAAEMNSRLTSARVKRDEAAKCALPSLASFMPRVDWPVDAAAS